MIEYKVGFDIINWDSIMDLFDECDSVIGLGRKREVQIIKESFKNSYKIVTAWDDDKIVGAARMLSDGYCYGWIHDVAVLESYRRKGVGKGVMEEIMRDENLLFGLTSSFMAVEFYDALGFKKHKTAMAKYPGPSTYLEE